MSEKLCLSLLQIYDDLYQIDKEWPMVKRFAKVTATKIHFIMLKM